MTPSGAESYFYLQFNATAGVIQKSLLVPDVAYDSVYDDRWRCS